MKHYEVEINLRVSYDAENYEDAKRQAYEFLYSVSRSEDLTDDEIIINELE